MNRLLSPFLIAGVVVLAGCASSGVIYSHGDPDPIAYPRSEQHKMQAAHHWELLAENEAAQIHEALKDKAKPVYVETPEHHDSDFAKAYHSMLIEHLVKQGGVVVTKPVFGGVIVSYFVVVEPTELIITTRVLEGNLVMMSDTDVFYYRPEDTELYLDQIAMRRGQVFQVVDQ